MSTDIVMGSDLALAVLDQEKVETSLCYTQIISHFWKSRLVRYDYPFLGKDSSSFQLVHG